MARRGRGLRFAECAGITVDRLDLLDLLDLLDGTVAVDRQLLRDGTLSDPKTGGGRWRSRAGSPRSSPASSTGAG